MRSAKKALDAHDLGRAIFFFRAAAKFAPRDPEPHFQLGLAYLEVGSTRDAVNELKTTTELDPHRFDAQIKLSEMYALSRNADLMLDAERRIKAVLNLSPGNPDALGTLALVEFGLGKQDMAIEHLQSSVERAPQNVKPAIALALIRIRQGNWQSAEVVLNSCAERAPKSVDTAVAIGRCYFAFGKAKEGEAQFRRALALDATSGAALFALGESWLAQGRKLEAERAFAQLSALPEMKYKPVHASFLVQEKRYDEALAELKALSKAWPEDRAVRTRLIGAFALAGKAGDAEELLSRTITKNPKDLEALLQRSEFYYRDHKLGEAEKDLNVILRYQPDSAQAHFLMAALYKIHGSLSNQKRELNQALQGQPRFLPARMSLVQFYIGNQDPRAAIDLLDHAPDDQRVTTAVQVTRNWALLAAGDMAEMGKSIETALKMARDPDLLIQKGIFEARQSRWIEARAAFNEVLEKDPDNTRALDALAQTYVAQNQSGSGVQRIREQVARRGGSARLRHLLGEWLLATGNHAEARTAFLQAKSVDSGYVAADWSLARLDLSEGKLDEGRRLLTASMGSNSSSMEAKLLLALLEDVSGNINAAAGQYRKLLDLEPANVIVLNNLAYLLADRANQPDEAEHYAKEAVNLMPAQSALRDTLGWIYYQKGMFRESLTHLEKAVQLEGTPRRKYHLAMAYLRLGRNEQGQRTLNEAMSLDSGLPEAMAALRVRAETSGRSAVR